MDKERQVKIQLLVAAGLIAINLVVFWRLFDADFVNYDDMLYVTENPMVLEGISGGSLKLAFTEPVASLWHPLTCISLMLDCQLSGPEAGPIHRTNIILHIANSILLFLVMVQFFKLSPLRDRLSDVTVLTTSALLALAFAIHPLHVEPVAWVSSRKDVLSTVFWLATMWAYLRYVQSQSKKAYAWALVFFVLGLMSKPMLVTLPCVLLLLDLWPLDRMKLASLREALRSTAKLLLEKAPFFAITIVFSVSTFLIQSKSGAVKLDLAVFTPLMRLKTVLVAYGLYVYRILVPTHLAGFYPHPALMGKDLPVALIVAGASVLIVGTAISVATIKRWPYLFVGWFWFVGTLFPVSGVIPIGAQLMADRYTYISLIGIFWAAAYGAHRFWQSKGWAMKPLAIAATILLLTWTGLAWRQARTWKDSETLWLQAIKVTEDNYLAHNNLAEHYDKTKRSNQAGKHFQLAIKANPDEAKLQLDYAIWLVKERDFSEAETVLSKIHEAGKMTSRSAREMAAVHAYRGDLSKAESYLRKAVDFGDNADILAELGHNLTQQRRAKEAITYLEKARSIRETPTLLNTLAVSYVSLKKYEEAAACLRQALVLNPNDGVARRNLQKIEVVLPQK